jgi:uncharacterized cupin superfamily protein
MHEAEIADTEHGRVPQDDGWFILNVADIVWGAVPGGGTWCGLSGDSPLLGIGIHVLWPGEAPGMYHRESNEEGFLVLSGECVAVVEGEERRMGPWDYLRCPPGTAHITVGAGDGPCALLMVGTRAPDERIEYLPDAAAARHGFSVERPTESPREAYAARPPISPARSPWPL